MNAALKPYIERFQALTDREQKLVILSVAVVVVAIFYFSIWSPLNTDIERQRQLVDNQRELLSWVEEQGLRAAQLRRSGSAGQTKFSGSLPQAVNSTTNRHNVVISRMQPQGEELQVWIDQVPFESFLAWLQTLENMGVVILQADISEADTAGHIRVRRLQLGTS